MQTFKGRLCKLDLPARSVGLCTDSLKNLENHLEGSKGHIVYVPSVENGSSIPETTSEIVRNPHIHLVEVQLRSERPGNLSDGSGTHKHPYSVRICTKATEKTSRKCQHSPEQAKTTKIISWHKDLVHSRGRWLEEACGASQKCQQPMLKATGAEWMS